MMRQLQLGGYLALLDGGTGAEPADDHLSKACLEQAQALWPQLRIGPWEHRIRRVEYVARCHASGKSLVHISAGWEDCFLIFVVPPMQSQAEAFLLFDIGAEYREAKLICPAIGLDGVADEESIRRCLPLLHAEQDPFAILEIGEGTYMQAYARDGMFEVEHQLVSLASHYRLESRANTDIATRLFMSYALGEKEWAREFKWTKIEL